MDLIKNNFIFFREFLQEFESTGSFCPTSKWAARALIEPLLGQRGKMRILEAGPGTGSVTVHILAHMRDDDELVICELNPRFMSALKENLKENQDFQRHRDRVSFFQGPVQELPDSGKFDLIVCAIPFLNLDMDIVRSIFDKFRAISHPNSALTYYEYMWLKKVGMAVSPERRKRLEELDGFFSEVKNQADTTRRRVWLNVLPINVYQIDGIAA